MSGTAKNIDELELEINQAITINGVPEVVKSSDHNALLNNLKLSYKPQALRKEQDGISSQTLDFSTKDCYFFNLNGGNFTLLGFLNSLQGREIKLVVFGSNRFLIDAAFTNVVQIGTHIKGQSQTCFVDCVPDQNGNDLFVFRWVNSSVVAYNKDSSYSFNDATNASITHNLKCEDTSLSTHGQIQTVIQKNGYSKLELNNELANHKVVLENSKTGFSQMRVERRDSVTPSKRAVFYGDISSDGKTTQNRIEQTDENWVDNIAAETFSRTQVYQSTEGNLIEMLAENNGTIALNMLALNGRYPYLLFQDGNLSSTMKYISGTITAWDMDNNEFYEIVLPAAYDFLSVLNIQSLSAMIVDDADQETWEITSGGTVSFFNNGITTKLVFRRYPTGLFDNVNFSNNTQSRGRWSMTFR